MAKKKSVPARQAAHYKRENKFIDMPKDQLIKLLIVVGAVILAIVLFFVLRNALDGHLPVKDGVVVTQGDNWIVGNTGTTSSPRYFKLGTVGEVEGYTLSTADMGEGVSSTPTYEYKPEGEAAGAVSGFVTPGRGAYDALATQVSANLGSYLPGAVVSEVDQSDVAGKAARSFTYSYEGQDPQDATKTQYMGGAYVYIKADHGLSIVVSASAQAQSAEALADGAAIKAEALKIAEQINLG